MKAKLQNIDLFAETDTKYHTTWYKRKPTTGKVIVTRIPAGTSEAERKRLLEVAKLMAKD